MDYKEITSYEIACKAVGIEPVSDEVFTAFGEDAKTMAAYHKLCVITRAINGGWQPDWINRNERKYVPYMYTNTAGLASACTHSAPSGMFTIIGSQLCFRDYERAEFAVKTFGDTLYKDYFRPADYEEQKEQESLVGYTIIESGKCDTCPNETTDCKKLILADGSHICVIDMRKQPSKAQ